MKRFAILLLAVLALSLTACSSRDPKPSSSSEGSSSSSSSSSPIINYNPDTGANDVMGLASALALVSIAAAGALIIRKK